MSKLIQALINLEHPQRHAPFSQEASLVVEINRLYQEATQEMWQKREGFSQQHWVTDSKIAESIQTRITAELDKMNLHRLADYKQIQAAIVNWDIQKTQSQANPKAVLAVKKALLACTADARKKKSYIGNAANIKRIWPPISVRHSRIFYRMCPVKIIFTYRSQRLLLKNPSALAKSLLF